MIQSGIAPLRRQRRREGVYLGLLAGAAFAGLAYAASPGDKPTTVVQAGSTVPPAVAEVATQPAAPLLAASTKPAALAPADEQRRRLLMMLLMNSAGPLGPYGSLGH